MTIDITCNVDDNYVQHCAAMLCSLFENNKEITFNVHILINKLSDSNSKFLSGLCQRYLCNCIFHKVDSSLLSGVKYRINRPLTEAAYFRCLLPSILDESIHKILYLDCDIIILNNILPLFNIELNNYSLAAVVDTGAPYNDKHRNQLSFSCNDVYFCSGMMLINLKYWRDFNAENKLLEYSKRDKDVVYLHDQDSLNYVFKGTWFILPPKWNSLNLSYSYKTFDYESSDIEEGKRSPVVVHYASDYFKPWFDIYFKNKRYYWYYLKKSHYSPTHITQKTFSFKMNAYRVLFMEYVYEITERTPPFIAIFINFIIDIIRLIQFFLKRLLNKDAEKNFNWTKLK